MSKAKKIGVILILVGICLPIISLGFASYYQPLGLIYNIQTMEIVLRQEPTHKVEILKEAGFSDSEIKEYQAEKKIAIPYKYIFALGVVLIFAGIGIIAISGNKKDKIKQ